MKVDLIATESRGTVLIDGQPLDGVIDITVCMAHGLPPRVMLTLQPQSLNVQADGAKVIAREPDVPEKTDADPQEKRTARAGGKKNG